MSKTLELFCTVNIKQRLCIECRSAEKQKAVRVYIGFFLYSESADAQISAYGGYIAVPFALTDDIFAVVVAASVKLIGERAGNTFVKKPSDCFAAE